MERAEALDRIWEDVEPGVYITREQFDGALDDWTIQAFDVGGIPAYVTMVKGPEFHFAILAPLAVATRKIMSACLKPIFDAYGYVITRTPYDDTRQQKFNKMLGFHPIATDEFFIVYRLDKEDAKWLR